MVSIQASVPRQRQRENVKSEEEAEKSCAVYRQWREEIHKKGLKKHNKIRSDFSSNTKPLTDYLLYFRNSASYFTHISSSSKRPLSECHFCFIDDKIHAQQGKAAEGHMVRKWLMPESVAFLLSHTVDRCFKNSFQ